MAARVVVGSEGFWREQLQRSPAAVGRVVKLDGSPATVVGVMPAAFQFPGAEARLWINLPLVPNGRRGPFFLRGIGRLRSGVPFARAQAETNAIGGAIEAAHPADYHHLEMPIAGLREAVVGNVERPLWRAMAAVLCLLSLAVVNGASLLLARALARAPEMATRVALGAGPIRILRQLLTESCVLALAGAAAGCGLAAAGLAWLRTSRLIALPRLAEVHLDGGVLAFTLAVALLTGVLAGLAPALHAARSRRGQVTSGLRARDPKRLRAWLAGVEVALALVLLTTAGVLAAGFLRRLGARDGYQAPPRQVLATNISIQGRNRGPLDAAGNNPADIAYFDHLLDRLRLEPGIASVALADAVPPNSWNNDDTFTIQGQSWSAAQFPSVPAVTISPGYFRTLGIPLLAGREFTADDVGSSPPVCIVSAALARRHFPGGSALGHFLKSSQPDLTSVRFDGVTYAIPYHRIVGVVGDVHYERYCNDALETVCYPYRQSSVTRAWVVVRSTLPGAAVGPGIRREASALDPDVVLDPTQDLRALALGSIATPRFFVILLALFAATALVLALSGIYGLLAYSVARRQREIGVRLALGARPGRLRTALAGEAVRIAAGGALGGEAVALALRRIVGGLNGPAASGTDAWVYAATPLLLIAAAAVAGYLPARRATLDDPLRALRCE